MFLTVCTTKNQVNKISFIHDMDSNIVIIFFFLHKFIFSSFELSALVSLFCTPRIQPLVGNTSPPKKKLSANWKHIYLYTHEYKYLWNSPFLKIALFLKLTLSARYFLMALKISQHQ